MSPMGFGGGGCAPNEHGIRTTLLEKVLHGESHICEEIQRRFSMVLIYPVAMADGARSFIVGTTGDVPGLVYGCFSVYSAADGAWR